MVTLPFYLPLLKLAPFWPLIHANISDQLPKSQKTVCKHTSMFFLGQDNVHTNTESVQCF